MDPLSIAANAASLAVLVTSISSKIGSIIVGIAHSDESIQEFQSSIQTLSVVLDNIEKTFRERKKQQKFDQKHQEVILNILLSLNRCLYSLKEAIPSTAERSKNAMAALILHWKSDLIATKRAHIASYTRCLQVSMTAELLANQWQSQASQDGLRLEIQALIEDIKKTDLYYRKRAARDSTVSSTTSEDVLLETQIAARNMEDWVGSTEDVAKTMIAYRAEEVATTGDPSSTWSSRLHDWRTRVVRSTIADHNIEEELVTGSSSVPTSHDSVLPGQDSDAESNEQSEEPQISAYDLEALIHEHQRVIKLEMEARLYRCAERDLKKLISLLKQRDGEDGEEVHDSEQMLARMLYKQSTTEALTEAKSILKNLLPRYVQLGRENPGERRDKNIRASAIKHFLASIYLELGQKERALKYAWQARAERQQNEAAVVLIDETCLLLASIHERMGDYISAAALRKRVEHRPIFLPESDTNIFDWLKLNMFLPDGRRTSSTNQQPLSQQIDYVNTRHPLTQQTPLQFAVTREAGADIIRGLLAHGASKDLVDDSGATPLLLAASTRNKRLVDALLKSNVNTAAIDNDGNSALHRVQSPLGGVEAAKLLLENCSEEAINAQDARDRTPLHYAAGYGNQGMVKELLSHRKLINVNAKDSGGDTPLHLAVAARHEEALIRLLVAAGADINVQNVHGKDALRIAKDVKPRMQCVVKFLKEQKNLSDGERRASTARTPSINSQASGQTFGLSQVRLNHSSISLPFSSRASVRSTES